MYIYVGDLDQEIKKFEQVDIKCNIFFKVHIIQLIGKIIKQLSNTSENFKWRDIYVCFAYHQTCIPRPIIIRMPTMIFITYGLIYIDFWVIYLYVMYNCIDPNYIFILIKVDIILYSKFAHVLVNLLMFLY